MYAIQALCGATRTGNYDEETLNQIQNILMVSNIDYNEANHTLNKKSVDVLYKWYEKHYKGKSYWIENGGGLILEGLLLLAGGVVMSYETGGMAESYEASNITRASKVSRETIMNDVNDTLSSYLKKIRKIDPDAKMGYRGSLANGMKGPHKGNAPFDPNDFDVDAFIVSDKLAEQFPKSEWFRSGRDIDSLVKLQNDIEKSFAKQFQGYRVDSNKPFTFRIFTNKEFINKISNNGAKMIK